MDKLVRPMNISCISDQPIGISSDALGNNRYALGLLGFIRQADTPVTVGIQGGWGSGKTSLINILQHQLKKQGDTLCVFVNAWEHSLFQNEGDKSWVAISLLSGVVESICAAIEEKTKLPALDNSPRISEEVKEIALREDSTLKRIGKFAVGLAAVSARIGAKIIADVEVPDGGKERSEDSRPTGARFIRELRSDLTHAVNTVTARTPYKKFVCFVDDLDRVHPKTAVEILDVLKNVFDVPDCVFILAIDFDVVVKGLEDKFGKKTPDNEREFRQYFDKIIQVPFSMPVGAYIGKMEKLLADHFIALDLHVGNLTRMTEVAWLATDGIPRGVKRIINTLSLLLRIREQSEENIEKRAFTSEYLEIMFIVVALQINFPEIYRKLAEKPNFSEWAVADLNRHWNLIFDDIGEEFFDEDGQFNSDELACEYGDSFNDEWEQVIYLLCQRNSWLKQKAVSVSAILNNLKEAKESCEGDIGAEYLRDALEAVNVTDVESNDAVRGEDTGPKNDKMTQFCQEVHRKLISQLVSSDVALPTVAPTKLWAKQPGGGRTRRYDINNVRSIWFGGLTLEWRDGLSTTVYIKPPRGSSTDFRNHVENRRPNAFTQGNTKDYWTAIIDGYESVDKITPEIAGEVAQSISSLILEMKKSAVDTFR